MNAPTPAVAGLRLTLRHTMIAVAYVAILTAGLRSLPDRPGREAGYAVARWVLLASPWLLGGLVWALDRAGPQRDWTAASLLFSFYPAATVFLDLTAALGAAETATPPRLGSLALFNALTLTSSAVFYWKMRRLRCPNCTTRTLIPLVRLTGQSRRLNHTRWCACCGGLFWRDPAGAWRVERRATWVDARRPVPPLDADSPAPARPCLDLATACAHQGR